MCVCYIEYTPHTDPSLNSASVLDWIDFVHLEETFFYERSISKNNLLLEIIERIGCTKSIQPSKEVRIVGHSVLD